jgi:16S rRNA (adenine1518-N6/adenine1519-N6)-dimethyltransferase
MPQTKTQIQSILSAAGASPQHRLGQNFMIDQNLVRVVAAAGEIAAGDLVVEVGPGTGTLTEALMESPAAGVVAVELDRALAGLLRERFASNERFTLIEGDALANKHQLNAQLLKILTPPGESAPAGVPAARKLVANLPYNIASPLVIELLLAGVDLLVFTVQKEVADRLAAAAGSDAYGPLSVMAQLLAGVEMLRTLPQQAFWPAPKIRSALVRMRRHDQLGTAGPAFGRFVHQIFSARRKTLRNGLLLARFDPELLQNQTGLDLGRRPEEFTPSQLLMLFHAARQDSHPRSAGSASLGSTIAPGT